ncbi:MAG: FAD-binding protein [Streptosporangiales bacterium]|nr:FAD-binding protein [Streptosporangiales bacterium]
MAVRRPAAEERTMTTMAETTDLAKAEIVDVLVVGAGPVGMMAAGELARRNVSVRVVDKAAERTSLSKALVIHARTLETMDLAGLAEEFVRRGYPVPGLNIGPWRRSAGLGGAAGSGHPVSVHADAAAAADRGDPRDAPRPARSGNRTGRRTRRRRAVRRPRGRGRPS